MKKIWTMHVKETWKTPFSKINFIPTQSSYLTKYTSRCAAGANSWKCTKYSQSNGSAEKAVSIAKNLLRKNEDLPLALLQYRNAPIPTLGYSPSQLLLSRVLRTGLVVVGETLKVAVVDQSRVIAFKQRRRDEIERHYDRSAKELPPLETGDQIYYKNSLKEKSSCGGSGS